MSILAGQMLRISLLVLLLSGCSAFHEKPLPASEATHIDLHVIWVDSAGDIPSYIGEANGAAVYYDVGGQRYCTVYAFKPHNLDDFRALQTLGHEVLHCTDGEFHNPVFDKNKLIERLELRQ